MRKNWRYFGFTLAFFVCGISACKNSSDKNLTIEVRDSMGQTIRLAQPVKRIAALSPHTFENVFAAGAGDLVIARSAYADYPKLERNIPIVNQYNNINLERLIELTPDLVIAWQSGIQDASVKKIRSLGIPVYLSEANQLSDVAKEIRAIGLMTNRNDAAEKSALTFEKELLELKQKYSEQTELSVFYQIASSPLYTIGGNQIISQVIDLCGGRNIFQQEIIKAPIVSKEAVIKENPDVILSANSDGDLTAIKSMWQKWRQLSAIKFDNIYVGNPDLISRASTRIIEGTKFICESIDSSRKKLL